MTIRFRISILFGSFLIAFFVFLIRLFFWQIASSRKLTAAAKSQYETYFELPAKRGDILASDGFPLAANQETYLAYASLPAIKILPKELALKLVSVVASSSARPIDETAIVAMLSKENLVWAPLINKISREEKEKIVDLKIEGIGFEPNSTRRYPEASMGAHLLGFVSEDKNSSQRGYFGLEGFYDRELKGSAGWLKGEKDARGAPILVGNFEKKEAVDGRTLKTTIERPIQFMVEEKLGKAVAKYGATGGSVVIMRPKTGEIIGMASYPKFDPRNFGQSENSLFINPVVSALYEPGSTFKVLVMASALNEKSVTPETECPVCDGPVVIAGKTIKTWDEKYPLNPTMSEIIKRSNNVGMVYVAQKLGMKKFVEYLLKFGFSSPTGIDLEGEMNSTIRPENNWAEIDLATASFGQGIAITPIQMIRAVNVLANGGRLVKPMVVKSVIDRAGEMKISPEVGKKILSANALAEIKEMMVEAVDFGEARWCKPDGYKIAGKTGTAQIPVAGHYDKEKTIASFVGFAPADDPIFTMLVTLREPKSSPWGSETAAPLWFEIAKELFNYYGVRPE